MADIKQMSFMVLIILVSINGVYEWSLTQEPIGSRIGFESMDEFSQSTLTGNLYDLNVTATTAIQTAASLDLWGFINALLGAFSSIWGIFMKLAFGWTSLLFAIFNAVNLGTLSAIFIAPLLVLQLLGAFYLIRDFVNTIRGVG